MSTARIKHNIDQALHREAHSGALRRELLARLPELNTRLLLPEREPVAALLSFIEGYIQGVPSAIALATAVSRRLGFFNYAAPFLHLAEDYFLAPPPEVSGSGLGALLDEAFLAHRLLEELNDHYQRQLGRSLLPQDMTEANLVVHHLLGDAYASRLEALVQYTGSQLLCEEYLWEAVRKQPGGEGSATLPRRNFCAEGSEVRLRLAC